MHNQQLRLASVRMADAFVEAYPSTSSEPAPLRPPFCSTERAQQVIEAELSSGVQEPLESLSGLKAGVESGRTEQTCHMPCNESPRSMRKQPSMPRLQRLREFLAVPEVAQFQAITDGDTFLSIVADAPPNILGDVMDSESCWLPYHPFAPDTSCQSITTLDSESSADSDQCQLSYQRFVPHPSYDSSASSTSRLSRGGDDKCCLPLDHSVNRPSQFFAAHLGASDDAGCSCSLPCTSESSITYTSMMNPANVIKARDQASALRKLSTLPRFVVNLIIKEKRNKILPM